MKEQTAAIFEQWTSLIPDVALLEYISEMAFYYGKVGLLVALTVSILVGGIMLIFGCFG